MAIIPAAKEAESAYALDDLRTFADVFNQIRQGYVEEIDDATLMQYAIEGMLGGLDPHSVYLTSDAFDDLQTSTTGEFSGLGLEVGMRNGLLRIIAPIDGSPAAEAGVMPGDIILKLDNNPIKGMSLGRRGGQDARAQGQRDRADPGSLRRTPAHHPDPGARCHQGSQRAQALARGWLRLCAHFPVPENHRGRRGEGRWTNCRKSRR